MGLADDSAAGIENAGHDCRVHVGNIAFKRRGAVHHGHAGQAYVVLQCDGLAGKLTAWRAFDGCFDIPGIMFVFRGLGVITGRTRIFHGWNIVRHRIDCFVGGEVGLHQGVVRFEFLVAHMHSKILGNAAQLIESGSSDCHGFFSFYRSPLGWAQVVIPINSPTRLGSPRLPGCTSRVILPF